MSAAETAVAVERIVADEPYAHTLEGEGPERWKPLHEHLACVADLASVHAAAFGSADWGELAGRWHDLGKYADDFQHYLRASSRDSEVVDVSVEDARKGGRVDHSTAGAVLVYERSADKLVGKNRDELPATAAALAMVIAGHHGELPARLFFERERLVKEEKQARLRRARSGGVPAALLGLDLPSPPDFLRAEKFKHITDTKEKS
jgi:CRISPR-associated endonuclease/helicase Cas3